MAAPPGWPYSPDGRFWWDGAAWQPVNTPPPGTGAPTPSDAAPRPRRAGTAVFVLVTMGTLIAALVLGGVAGGAVGLATTDGPDKVLSVKARCDLGVRAKACTSLFSMMADTLLSPDRALRGKAEAWAGKNADKAAVTAIGGVRLETSPRPHSMEAVPAI